MSLNEKKRNKQLPDIYLTEGICRSKSFAGLSHRRASSADVTFSSSDFNFDAFTSSTLQNGFGGVFSQSSNLGSAKSFIHAISSSKSSKIHKAPRPQRTQTLFDAVSKGLKNSIHLAQNDISTSRVAFDNISMSSVMQMKANGRLLRKLEFQLAKLEELKEQYDVQHKMRDGIRTMAYAYILSPGKEKDNALQSVKQQFKECTELMCSMECKLESLMGTLLFEMKGIQGFARICAGDIFEVVIKHGDQKWKSRGRVMKNGEQMWENKFTLFKALFSEPLYIKALEVRGLGKNVLLGNKFCEIHDLFCAHPQQMTINLNASGSLKLNLIITWNPLSYSSSSSGLPYSFGRNSISQSSIQEAETLSELSIGKESFLQSVNFCDNTGQSFSSESTSASASAQNSAVASPDVEVMTRACTLTADNNLVKNASNSTSITSHLRPRDVNCNDSCSWSILTTGIHENTKDDYFFQLESDAGSAKDLSHNLSDILKNLSLIVSDVSESYPEVSEMAVILEDIEEVLKDKCSNGSGSDISISIESALGCFDFLNSAIENDDLEGNEKLCDDLISTSNQTMELDHQMQDGNNEKYIENFVSNTLSYSSGNEDVDTILTDHLLHCTNLISALVTSGPGKHLEKCTLSKLRKQQLCLTQLLSVLQRNTQYDINDFFDEKEQELKDLWIAIAGSALFCTYANLSSEMEKIIKMKAVLDNYMASIVCPRLLHAISIVDSFCPVHRISVLQFKLFFIDHKDPDAAICEFAADTLAAEDLKCRDVHKAFAAVSVLSKITPSPYSLFLIGCLLIEKNTDLKNIASCYLKTIGSNSQQRMKVISSYIDMLLSSNVTSRLLACAALDALEAKQCLEQLSVVAAHDENPEVREAANSVVNKFEKLALEETGC